MSHKNFMNQDYHFHMILHFESSRVTHIHMNMIPLNYPTKGVYDKQFQFLSKFNKTLCHIR